MLSIYQFEVIKEIAQKQMNQEYRDYFDKPAPVLSSGIIRVILEAALESGLVELEEKE